MFGKINLMKKWLLALALSAGLVSVNATADTWYNKFRDGRDIPFTQNGTGAVKRDLDAKLKETVSVLDFGADKTGVANSKAAFQAAFDAAAAAGGGTVLIPDGAYLISGGTASVLTGGNVHIKGASPGGALIVNGNTNLPAIRFGDNLSLRYGNAISNVSCAQKSGVTPVFGNACLAIYAQGQFRMDHVTVTSYPAAVYDGILAYGVSTGTLHDIWVQNTLNHGITFGSTQIGGNTLWTSDLYATAMRSDANGAVGFNMFDVQGLYAANWSAYGNGTNGCSFTHGPYSDSFNGNNFLLNVICDTSAADNFYISDLRDSTLTNVWASTQKSTSVNTTASGFVLTTNRVQNISFNNSFALLNNGFGVNVYDPTGAAGTNSPSNIRFNNFVFGSTAGSLAHGNGASGFGYGLVANGASSMSITGGLFQGNATGTISLANSATYISRNVSGVTDFPSIPLSGLAQIGANTTLGNSTSGTANVTALSMPSCSTSASAINWTSNTGWGCNTSINAATLGGATFASPGTIGGTAPGPATFTTLGSGIHTIGYSDTNFGAGLIVNNTATTGNPWARLSLISGANLPLYLAQLPSGDALFMSFGASNKMQFGTNNTIGVTFYPNGGFEAGATSGTDRGIGTITALKALMTGAAAPTASSCGTGPAVDSGSSSNAGKFTIGTGATACTLTFANAFTTNAYCTVTPLAQPAAVANIPYISAQSGTAFTVSGGTASTAYQYTCGGN